MNTTNEQTTFICLFHDPAQAEAAVTDLILLGIPKRTIGVMMNPKTASANPAAMEKWKVPQQDIRQLTDGMNKGGVVIAVSAGLTMVEKVEAVFSRYHALPVNEPFVKSGPTPN